MTQDQKTRVGDVRALLRERVDHLTMLRGMSPGSSEGVRNMARAIDRVEARIAELRAALEAATGSPETPAAVDG